MRIVAIDSSGLVASVAILENDSILATYSVNYKKTHSQTLLPMLDAVAKMIDLDLDTVDAIAIAKGPGSFTGLRIGSATAKGLGLALDKPIVEIPTVDGLAYNLWGAKDLVCPLMDARRNQTYTGIYAFEKGEMQVLEPQCAVDIAQIVEKINELQRAVIFLGDGVPVFWDYIAEHVQVPYFFAPAHLNKQRAGAVAALAFRYLKNGQTVSAAEHQPDYLRLSQAERERKEKEQRLPGDAGV